MEVWCS